MRGFSRRYSAAIVLALLPLGALAQQISGGSSGGTPGGSNTQLQYNNSGAFGGITGATTNGTAVTLTSPVLVTPALGVATATSVAIGGCTIGANAECITGNFAGSGTIVLTSGSSTLTSGGSTAPIMAGAAASYDFGTGASNNSSVFVNVGNARKASWNSSGHYSVTSSSEIGWASGSSPGTNDTRMTRAAAGVVAMPDILTDATHTDTSLCQDTTTHGIYFGSGAAGICLGTSSARYKHDIQDLNVGLLEIERLRPVSYKLNADHGDPDKVLYGFVAEDTIGVLPKLVGLDTDGKPNSMDYMGVVPVLVKAVQEQQSEIDGLKAEIASLRTDMQRAGIHTAANDNFFTRLAYVVGLK